MPMWSNTAHYYDGTYTVRWYNTRNEAAMACSSTRFTPGDGIAWISTATTEDSMPTRTSSTLPRAEIYNGHRYWMPCTDGMLKGAHGPGHFFDRDTMRGFGTKLYPNAMWHSGTGADSLWLWVQSDHHPVDGRIYRICGMRRPSDMENYATVFHLDPLGRPTGYETTDKQWASPYDRWVYRSLKDATMYAQRIMSNPDFTLPSIYEEVED